MASKIGIYNSRQMGDTFTFPHHNPQTSAPGLPVKAAEIIYAGCQVAWDPANAQAFSAYAGMPATSFVIGRAPLTIDNRAGAKGDLKTTAECGIFSFENDGTVTVADIFKPCLVVDDHTVGTGNGPTAGVVIGLDGDQVWVDMRPNTIKRALSLAVTSAQNATATPTDTASLIVSVAALKTQGNALQVDVAAIKTLLQSLGFVI